MPVAYHDRFAEWMASPPSTGRLIEGVAVLGNWWVGGMWFARSVYEPVSLPDEHGITRTWAPANIDIELPTAQPGLEQDVRVIFSGLRNDQVVTFSRMPPERLAGITKIRLYAWLHPDVLDAPLVAPPPWFVVEEVTLAASSLELVCSGPLLPNRRAGEVYTVEKFPGLATE